MSSVTATAAAPAADPVGELANSANFLLFIELWHALIRFPSDPPRDTVDLFLRT